MRASRVPFGGSDEVEALVTDQYLDSLLRQAEHAMRRTADGVAPGEAPTALASIDDPELGPALHHAARILRASLLRAHPSFRFEERLAAELAAIADPSAMADLDMLRGAAAGGSARLGDVIPFPAATSRPDDPLLAAVLDGRLDPADEGAVERAAGAKSPARPLLVGGAITSAAISLMGVAWVAWRASRPGAAPMARAARVARARRLADMAELGEYASGLHGGHL